MRTHKPVSVSLSPELFELAEKRAKDLGFRRATYIQQLILADLRKQKAEDEAAALAAAVARSHIAPSPRARQRQPAKKAAAKRPAPAKKPAAKKSAKGRR